MYICIHYIFICMYMYIHIYLHIYVSTYLSACGKIRQAQSTTSCHHFGIINLNSIGISTAPGGTVQTKMFSTNKKGLGENSNLMRNARWSLRFSCTVYKHCCFAHRIHIRMYSCMYVDVHIYTYMTKHT